MTGSGCFDNDGGVSLVGEMEYGMEWWKEKSGMHGSLEYFDDLPNVLLADS